MRCRRDSAGRRDEDALVLALTDDDIANRLPELRLNMLHSVLAGRRIVIVDLAAVTCLSSTLLAALLNIHRICRARGGSVVLRHPNAASHELLRSGGLDRVFKLDDAEGNTQHVR